MNKDDVDRLEGKILVLEVVIGNLLPAFRGDVPTRARLECALESLLQELSESPTATADTAYRREARDTALRLRQTLLQGPDSADPSRFRAASEGSG